MQFKARHQIGVKTQTVKHPPLSQTKTFIQPFELLTSLNGHHFTTNVCNNKFNIHMNVNPIKNTKSHLKHHKKRLCLNDLTMPTHALAKIIDNPLD